MTGLAVELFLVWSLVEVQIAAEDLIGAFAGHDHLHPQRLDLPRHQKHRRASPDRRHVVSLHVVYHFLDRINPVLSHSQIMIVKDPYRK